MGHVTCGLHEKVRCCWRCDRCPRCDGIGRLQRGDYCGECTRDILAHGGTWDPSSKDYDPPGEDVTLRGSALCKTCGGEVSLHLPLEFEICGRAYQEQREEGVTR